MDRVWDSFFEDDGARALLQICEQQFAAGEGVESVLGFLRKRTESKPKSILILCRARGLSVEDAKEMVDLSQAWSDVRERDQAFHHTLMQAVELLADEN